MAGKWFKQGDEIMAKAAVKVLENVGVEVVALIDKGAAIDTELKNLGFQDKGIKAKLGELVGDSINLEDGPSVKVSGDNAIATITKKQALSLNVGCEAYAEVEKAMKAGLLAGAVEKILGLAVAPDQIEKAAEALKAAGIGVTVTSEFKVVPEQERPAAVTAEEQAARKALVEATEVKFSFAIKYEAKKA